MQTRHVVGIGIEDMFLQHEPESAMCQVAGGRVLASSWAKVRWR